MTEEPAVPNANSILNTIKIGLGIAIDDTSFDSELLIHINAAVMSLEQLGVPVVEDFVVTESDEWDDLLGAVSGYQALKSYFVLKVRVVFDPPTSAYVLDSYNRTITEMEWRLCAKSEEGSS